jgi:hypothetical protein
MKANAVKKQLVEWTDKMAKLREFLAASEQRIKEIDQERAPLLVDAFTGDSEAETKLRKLNAELDSASRDRADANQAIEQASREIARLKAAVQEAATGEKLEAVRSLIRARISDAREQRIVELGRKLKGELNALESSTR